MAIAVLRFGSFHPIEMPMRSTRYLATLLIVFGSLGNIPSFAAEPPAPAAYQLARKSGCFNCHSIETDDIGPAWRKVAAKYRGNPNAEAMLVNKVTVGGKGVWGYLPMPSFAHQLREDEIRTLVRYVLSLK